MKAGRNQSDGLALPWAKILPLTGKNEVDTLPSPLV